MRFTLNARSLIFFFCVFSYTHAQVTLVKQTNGVDTGSSVAPTVQTDSTVTWTYIVSNGAASTLSNIIVSDDQEGPISCPASLAAGGVFTCTASGTALEGPYTNTASLSGATDDIGAVSLSYTSSYTGQTLSVSLDKTTNGVQAGDSGSAVPIVVGDPVTWHYTISNTGSAPLSSIVLLDNQEGQISCVGIPSSLAAGAQYTCSLVGTAVNNGIYSNSATVTAYALGASTQATDVSFYSPVVSPGSATIVKTTNGVDTFVSKVPRVRAGSVVTWVYEVTNNGEFDLTSVTVTDDRLDSSDIMCPSVPVLNPTSSFTCSATGIAAKCGYTNVGCVKTYPPLATRTCHGSGYNGIHPGISMTKYTNNLNSDRSHNSDNPPCVQAGCEVVWSYVVSNVGDDVLTNVYVYDGALNRDAWCPTNKMSPWQTITCISKAPDAETNTDGEGEGEGHHSGSSSSSSSSSSSAPAIDVAITGLYSNIATAHGSPVVGGDEVTAEDTNWYMGVQAGMRLTVTVNDVVATGGAGSYNGQCPTQPKPNPCKNCDKDSKGEGKHQKKSGDDKGSDDSEDDSDDQKSPSWEGGENFVNGANVNPGDELNFAFVVYNYGSEELENVYISFPDQKHGAVPFLAISAHHDVTCPTSTLAVGSSMTCTASTKVISYGSQYLRVEATALGACDGVNKYRASATGRWFSVKPQFANGGEGEAEGGRGGRGGRHHGRGEGGRGEGRGEHGNGEGSTPPTTPPNPIPPNAGSGGCDAIWWIANSASYPSQWNQWTKYYVAAGLTADPLADQTLSKVLRADDTGLNPFYRNSAVALLNAATNPDFGVSLAIVQADIQAALSAYFVQGDDTLVNQYLPLFASWAHPC